MGRDSDSLPAQDPDLAKSTASTQIARSLLFAASTYGHDPRALAARFGLTDADLADPDGRLPSPVVVAMWEEIPRIVGDERFGLRLGRLASAGAVPILGYIVQTSATLGEGLRRALRYQRVVQTLNPAELRVTGSEARVLLHMAPRHVERLRFAAEFAMAFFVAFSEQLVGRRLSLRSMRFAHAAPSSVDEHEAVFGVVPTFASDPTELVFHRDALDWPVHSANAELGRLVERHADALLARIPDGDSFAQKVRAALASELSAGRGTVAAAAKHLKTSPRTLQRRLRAEGTSAAQVLDEVRRDLALRYVEDPALSLADVAYMLGFADQTTFHRAFVRWTGRPPGTYRKAPMERAR